MIKSTYRLFIFCLSLAVSQTYAEENKLISINLKHISGDEVTSVLKSLIDKSVSIREENNVLLINGAPSKTKNIVHIIDKIDTPAIPLTIEFIASNRKINFKDSGTTYQSGKNNSNTSQSMSITERQWVTLNTGLSIPIAERKRLPDGTETQSFRFKKISKQYVFKVHEFSGWSVVQVGLNVSKLSNDVAGAIAHTKLDTTIVGKTDEWMEVASSNPISKKQNSTTYSTNRDTSYIHLYVKVKKSAEVPQNIINTETKTDNN